MARGVKRSAWGAVSLYQPFLLLIVGPVPALGLSVWNAFHLRAPGRWVQAGIAVGCAALVASLTVFAGLPAAQLLADWTGLPLEIAGSLIKTLLIFMTGLVIASLTLRQLDAYKKRLFHGPVPSEKLRLMGTVVAVSLLLGIVFASSDLPVLQQAFMWRAMG